VLCSHPLFAVLEESARRALVQSSRSVSYRGERTILREGEEATCVYFLLSGSVRVYHKKGEIESTVKLFRAPALFGEMEVLAGKQYLVNAKTIEASEILMVPSGLFRQLVDKQPAFAAALVRDLSARLCIARSNERCLAFDDVDTRLANLLLDYSNLAGAACEEGIRIEMKLSQERMALDLGVSRKSVLRSLDRFEQLGVVSKSNGRYVIRDVDALKAHSSDRIGLVYGL
jgi:CRP/FNR family transcriptional regulator, anaerobic regulatory protein